MRKVKAIQSVRNSVETSVTAFRRSPDGAERRTKKYILKTNSEMRGGPPLLCKGGPPRELLFTTYYPFCIIDCVSCMT
jgi:hypothetical protein